MRTPGWLVIVPLFVIVWFMAMVASGWPRAVAYASDGQRPWDAGHAAVVSQGDNEGDDSNDGSGTSNTNSNEADDDDDNDEANSGDNDDDEANSGDNGDDDNHNREQVNVVPVPVAVPVPAPAPASAPPAQAAAPVDEVSQCLANGGTLVYHGPDAGIAVKSFQDNLNITLTRVNPTSQPMPPGVPVGNYFFRLSASPCGGAPYTVLPSEINLAVSYSDTLAVGRDEARFALMRYDGTTWTAAPKLVRDANNNHVSASVTGLGVYALVQQ